MFSINKKKHFKKRLRAVDEAILDLEFQREKLRTLREDVRVQYDRMNEASQVASRRMEEEKDQKVLASLKAVVDKYAPDLEYKLKQLQGLDNEIAGEGNPQSCEARIEGFRALRAMYKEYMKKM